MEFNKLTLRSKILIGGLSPLIFLLFTGVMSIMSIDSIVETNSRVIFTHEIIQHINDAMKAVVDMETGMRGFLLSGKDQFLEPYKNGKK
ncbi:MAG: hypothetical protein OMM_07406 [Candidatus Magnetoglobus multicellularis str. Araruama]|uniref:CHASE3 domain-containing protein n=1 Tax=Candidatus Magnetoglobus multicellularis str. Araruama TaxID=890399 RepID=A0A1V1PCQ6_9BACT|nr:MAG: hypothetical protein OMM_07406 [Candidatus Magnetoglobus multicellularis str. Araruama]